MTAILVYYGSQIITKVNKPSNCK